MAGANDFAHIGISAEITTQDLKIWGIVFLCIHALIKALVSLKKLMWDNDSVQSIQKGLNLELELVLRLKTEVMRVYRKLINRKTRCKAIDKRKEKSGKKKERKRILSPHRPSSLPLRDPRPYQPVPLTPFQNLTDPSPAPPSSSTALETLSYIIWGLRTYFLAPPLKPQLPFEVCRLQADCGSDFAWNVQ